ncbi:hypothetical protein [Streptomyces sp. CC208A]|uniref:hypothetical protein n=1 Tax=Streptomyces sp. CC208A TaxID=3044573 RepID=UPI0024A8851C|nr:hypothetical protein [Streptomyces sp. CC208A]
MATRRTGSDVPPGRQALAKAVCVLYGRLAVKNLAEAAELLESRGWKKDPSEISRYRNGRRKPPLGFLEQLHGLATERTELGAVWPTLAELKELHAAAEATLCRNCHEVRQENQLLREENSRLLAHTVLGPRPEPLGSSGSILAGSIPSTALPVPRTPGDRQSSARDVAAARQLATSASRLHGNGQTGHAVALLQDVARALTPLESAASIVLLRDEQNDLAETAIGIHSRSRADKDIMQIAVELHSFGLPEEADALLRATIAQAPAQRR